MSVDSVVIGRQARGGNVVRQFSYLLKACFLMYIRSKTNLFWVILFPIMYMLLFGAIYGNQKTTDAADAIPFINFLIPGALVMTLLANGIMGNAGLLANWRERGILRRIEATTLPVWQILASRILVQSVIMVGQAVLLVATGVLVFGAKFDVLYLVEAIPAVILCAITCMAFGQVVAALVRKAETVNVVSNALYFPLLFLSGLVLPLSIMPDFLQAIGKWLPSAMMGDIVRGTMLQNLPTSATTNLPFAVSLLGVVLYLAIAMFVGVRFFKWK